MPPRTDAMDTQFPSRSVPMAEAQLVLLYMLKRLESATDANLLDFLTETGLMNYMDMMPAIGRLVEEGAVLEAQEGVCRRYTLSPSGEEMLALYEGRIPFSAREKIEANLPEWQAALRAQRDYRADMAQTPRGDYEVSLRMMERGRPVMTPTVNLPSSEIAARMCKRWQREGGNVFRTLLSPLIGEKQP